MWLAVVCSRELASGMGWLAARYYAMVKSVIARSNKRCHGLSGV